MTQYSAIAFMIRIYCMLIIGNFMVHSSPSPTALQNSSPNIRKVQQLSTENINRLAKPLADHLSVENSKASKPKFSGDYSESGDDDIISIVDESYHNVPQSLKNLNVAKLKDNLPEVQQSVSNDETANKKVGKLVAESRSVKSKGRKSMQRDLFRLGNGALKGNLKFVKHLIERNVIPDNSVFEKAIESGNVVLVDYLTKYVLPTYSSLEYAARIGQSDMVKYFLDFWKRIPEIVPDKRILDDAASGHSVDLVNYLINNYPVFPDETTLRMAVQSGDILMTKYLVEKQKVIPTQFVIDIASHLNYGSDKFSLYKYLTSVREGWHSQHQSKSRKDDQDELNMAAQHGNMEFVKFLMNDKNIEHTSDTLKWASGSGNMQLVQHLIGLKSVNPDTSSLSMAIRNGHKHIAEYLLDNFDLKANKEMLDSAAHHGHIEIVKYLTQTIGIEADQNTVNEASISGSFETVKFLIKTLGVKPDEKTVVYASFGRNPNLLKYVSQHVRKETVAKSLNHASLPKSVIESGPAPKSPKPFTSRSSTRFNRFFRIRREKSPDQKQKVKSKSFSRPSSEEKLNELKISKSSSRSRSLEPDLPTKAESVSHGNKKEFNIFKSHRHSQNARKLLDSSDNELQLAWTRLPSRRVVTSNEGDALENASFAFQAKGSMPKSEKSHIATNQATKEYDVKPISDKLFYEKFSQFLAKPRNAVETHEGEDSTHSFAI